MYILPRFNLYSCNLQPFLVDKMDPNMSTLDKVLALLQTYKGRDRFLRLLSYSSKCAAGLIKSPTRASQFDNFSKQLSASRACFRLLDDIPVFADIICNGQSKLQEGSTIENIILRVESIIDVLFNPFDHISWAIEHRIILSNSTIWDTASTWCWVISLYLTLIKIAMKLSKVSQKKIETSELNDRESQSTLTAKQLHLKLNALKCAADLLFAVNYLPKGVLWAEFFNKWQVGALGSFSSVVALYQAIML